MTDKTQATYDPASGKFSLGIGASKANHDHAQERVLRLIEHLEKVRTWLQAEADVFDSSQSTNPVPIDEINKAIQIVFLLHGGQR